jgi:integrase
MKRKDCRKPRGSVYDNNGYWYVDVKLPGEEKRKKHPLCAPGSDKAMRSDRPKEMAIEAAHRLWENATRQYRVSPSSRTVDDICTAYLQNAETYYRGGSEVSTVTCAIRPFREMFGDRHIAELVHTDMVGVRDAMIRQGLSRNTINRYMRIIANRLLPWALDEGLIRANVKAELSQVQPLKRGRSAAHETPPIRPVNDVIINATIEHMMPNTADMVRVHRLTGMRPEELCAMRWVDIDQSMSPWLYRPQHHKNEWRNLPRVILIGPRAREILLRHQGGEYPFSPISAVAERMAELRANATSPSRYDRKDPHAVRVPRNHWDTCSYTKTIHAACDRAGIDRWGANRLRHAFATEVRRKFGLEACRAVLGHSMGAAVTDRYSFEALEDECIEKAAPAVEALG